MKWVYHSPRLGHDLSRPAWGAWIEMVYLPTVCAALLSSRPAWGAWIEMARVQMPDGRTRGRAPHGARGLKYSMRTRVQGSLTSRPAWGAWIEIRNTAQPSRPCRSRPAWGAWIEIRGGRHGCRRSRCRAPHGARGLKCDMKHIKKVRGWSRPAWGAWIEITAEAKTSATPCVAPRMGRVD